MEERDRLAKIILFCTKIKWSLLCSNLTLVTCRKLDAKDILATIKRPKECQLDSIYYRRNVLPSEHGRRNSVPFQQIFCNRKSKACRERASERPERLRRYPTLSPPRSFASFTLLLRTQASKGNRVVLSKRQTFLSTLQHIMHSELLSASQAGSWAGKEQHCGV